MTRAFIQVGSVTDCLHKTLPDLFFHLCPPATMSTDIHHLTAPRVEIPYSRPGTPPPDRPPLQIGFCGLGAMGYFMARNLSNDRHSHPRGAPPLLVYNRSRAKSEKLQTELGPNKIRIAESAKELAKECDVIITSLAKDDVVKAVFAQFKQSLSVPKFLVLFSMYLIPCRKKHPESRKYSSRLVLAIRP